MLSEEILVQLKYNAPVINVVFSNESLGFIEAEQRDNSHQPLSGVDLPDTDWATVAEGYGAIGYTVRTVDEARRAFTEAKQAKKVNCHRYKTIS
jgi:pyruvate oxidase